MAEEDGPEQAEARRLRGAQASLVIHQPVIPVVKRLPLAEAGSAKEDHQGPVQVEDHPDAAALVRKAKALCAWPQTLGAFQMKPAWLDYALSDLLQDKGNIYGTRGRRNASSYACGNRSFAGAWPHSLYCEYRRAYPPPRQNTTELYTNLFQVVKRRIGYQQKNQVAAVHIRLGDVIDNSTHSVEEMLTNQTYYYNNTAWWNAYVMPLDHYRRVAAALAPGQPVTLVGSPHKPAGARWTQSFKSCVYTYAVAAYMQDLGHPVRVRVGHTPDDDFIFMANSETFARGGGAYSVLIGKMVEMNGGKVITTRKIFVLDQFLNRTQLE